MLRARFDVDWADMAPSTELTELDAIVAQARAEFAGRLGGKVDDLDRLFSSGAWAELRVASHKLRGSAATYGFVALGALAGQVEDLLIEVSCSPDAAARDRVRATLVEARAEARRASEPA
jgi:HPt (histidine-containing phosphotransfer) domain-containing protein